MLFYLKTLIAIEILLIVGLALFRACLTKGNRDVVDRRAVAITLLIPAVALLGHSYYVFLAFLTVAVWMGAARPGDRCSIYLLMLPMTPELAMFVGAGGIYLIPFSTIVAMNFGALLAAVTMPERRAIRNAAIDLGVVLLILLFTFIYGRDGSVFAVARGIATAIVGLGGPYLLVSRGIATREQLDRALLRFALGGFVVATVALFQTIRHWILYQAFYDALNVSLPLQSATLNLRGGHLRTGGPMIDYTAAGLFFAAVLMTLPYLKGQFRAGRFWGMALAIAGGLFVTQSRGAWIGAAIGFGAILVYRGQMARALALGVGALVIRSVLDVLVGENSRLAETVGNAASSVGTVDYRRKLLSRGLEQIAAHPLFGQNPKQLAVSLADLTQGQHIVDFVNSHLFVAMASGFAGFGVWMAVWLGALAMAWRVRRGGGQRSGSGEVPFGILAACLTGLAATSMIDRNLTWPMIALALTAPCVAFAKIPRRRVSGHGSSEDDLLPRLPRAQRRDHVSVGSIGP